MCDAVTRTKQVIGFCMIAFWLIVTNHCALELIPSLEFLACTPQAESAQHAPSDCGDGADACATIESGVYKIEENQGATLEPVAAAVAVALLSEVTASESSSEEVAPIERVPELARVWQFCYRTALPPRAPSLLS